MKKQFNPEIWQTERRKFDPTQWVSKQDPVKNKTTYISGECISKLDEVEIVVSRIEEARIDLTANYLDWVKLGFAFASEFGESGRNFFHRISKFYSGYNFRDCNRQYDKCRDGKYHSITIKTFFAAAYNAGIDVKINLNNIHSP